MSPELVPELRNLTPGSKWRETHEHFLSWFFDVWMKRIPEQEGRSKLLEILASRGFLDGKI